MSFLAPKMETPSSGSLGAERRNTYNEAESVPLVRGYGRVGVKWITDRFNDHWSSGSQTGQAYCAIAGIVCHGLIAKARLVFKNGDVAGLIDLVRSDTPADPAYWYGAFEFGGLDTQIGVANKGRIYWGREDQPADSWLVATTGQDHPPYRGQAYIIFERLHCGQIQAHSRARPAVPSIELAVVCLPGEDLPGGLRLPATLDAYQFRGVNLVSAIYEILTHKRAGLGAAQHLNTADWITKAAALEAGTKPASGLSGGEAYLSPILSGTKEAEQIINDLLAYPDGFLYATPAGLAMDWFPNDGVVPGDLVEITEHDLIGDPELELDTLDAVPSSVAVVCTDFETDLAEAVETHPVPLALESRGDSDVLKLERPAITYRDSAAIYAAKVAAMASVPGGSGSLPVRRNRAVRADGSPLRPGDRFLFNYAPLGLLLVARLLEVEDAGSGEVSVTLHFAKERGTAALPYVPAVDPREDYSLPTPATPGTGDWVALEVPGGIGAGALLVLARRPQNTLSGVNVYADDDNNWAVGQTLLGQQGFAAYATLNSTIDSDDTSVDITGTDFDLSPTLGDGVNANEQADDTLLAYVGGEWLSVGAVTSVSANVYQLAIARARLGSTAAAHVPTDPIWIIRRVDLVWWAQAMFVQNTTKYAKIAYYHTLEEGTLSAAKSVAFRNLAPAAPTGFSAAAQVQSIFLTWTNPEPGVEILVYESASNSIPGSHSFVVAGEAFTRGGYAGGELRYFWIKARKSGLTSSAVGSVNATAQNPSGGTQGDPGAAAPVVTVTADADIFLHLKNGTITPSSATLTATPVNISSPTYQWQYWTGSAWTNVASGGTSATYAVANGDFSNQRSFRCLVNGLYFDTTALAHIFDGTDNRGALLTNEAHTIACDYTGAALSGELGSSGKAKSETLAYRGATQLTATAGTPGAGQFKITITPSGCTASIGADNKTVQIDTVSADSGSVAIDVNMEAVTTVSKIFTWSKAKAGNPGTAAVDVVFSNEAHAFPADVNGNVSNYANSGTTIRVFEGSTELTFDPAWTTANGGWKVVATPTNITTGSIADSGAFATVGVHSGFTAGQDTAVISYLITGKTAAGAAISLAKSQTFTKARQGAGGGTGDTGSPGTDGLSSVLSLPAITLAADASGTVASYASAVSTMSVFKGVTDDSANWTFSQTLSNCTVTASNANRTATVTAMSADSAYVDITATRATYPTIVMRFSLAKARRGTTGDTGGTGATGSTGAAGPGLTYRGDFAAGTLYYHTATRRDVVSVSAAYYAVNNTGLNGSAGSAWGTPPGGNWETMTGFASVATDLLLAQMATITQTLLMGTAGAGGIIRTANATSYDWTTGAGYYFDPAGKIRVGKPDSQTAFSVDENALIYGDPAERHVKVYSPGGSATFQVNRAAETYIAAEVLAGASGWWGSLKFGTDIELRGRVPAALGGRARVDLSDVTDLVWAGDTTLARESAGVIVGTNLKSAGWLMSMTALHLRNAAGCVYFGASDDVNLYRSAADALRTDDAFYAAGLYGGNTSVASDSINVNVNGSGNRYAYIDLVGDDTYTDYGLRLIRMNTGADAVSSLGHRGTGVLEIKTIDAGAIQFATSSALRFSVAAAANELRDANGNKVLTTRQGAIADPSFDLGSVMGTVIAILNMMRPGGHGLISS